jgi:hypothetical protein
VAARRAQTGSNGRWCAEARSGENWRCQGGSLRCPHPVGIGDSPLAALYAAVERMNERAGAIVVHLD